MGLSKFILALQWERAAVSLSVFLDSKSGKTTDLSKFYAKTDAALQEVQWRRFGPEKVFETEFLQSRGQHCGACHTVDQFLVEL